MRNYSGPDEHADCCIDWMPNITVRAGRHQTAGRGLGISMEAANPESHPRPKHEKRRSHLERDNPRLRRKQAVDRKERNESDREQEKAKKRETSHRVRIS